MSYKSTDNTATVEQNITQKASLFLRFFENEVVKISLPKTPKKTNRLRLDILKQVLGLKGKIAWGKKYAVFQETKQFKNYSTPGTGPHFAENAIMKAVKLTGQIAKKAGF